MPEVLAGEQPGINLGTLILSCAGLVGENPTNRRFRNEIIRFANETILDIQLNDPHKRRTVVHDAEFTTIAGQAEYDVRKDAENGGFGWTNCFRVKAIVLSGDSTIELEPIDLSTYRNRAAINPGTPFSVVMIDDVRIRLVPAPTDAVAGVGDYYQDIPQITEDLQNVDWPRAWDVALQAGVRYLVLQWREASNVAAWRAQFGIYQDKLAALRSMERNVPRKNAQATIQRNLRSRLGVQLSNDRDIRKRYR